MGIYTINNEPVKDKNDHLSSLEVSLYPDEPGEAEDLIEDSGIGCRAGTLHVVRVSIGTGILVMPFTFMKLGYLMGGAVFLLAGIIYYYVARMALHTETKMCQKLGVQHLSYVELASNVFEASPFPFNKCGSLVKYFICVFYSIPFANTVYLVVMGKALHSLAKELGHDYITPAIAISVLIIPLTIFCLFQQILRMLAPYSSVTNVITVVLTVAIVVVSVVSKVQPEGSMVNNKTEPAIGNGTRLAALMANATGLGDPMTTAGGLADPMATATGLADTIVNKTLLGVNKTTVNKTEPFQMTAIGDIGFIPQGLAMYIQVFSCTSLLFAMKSDMQKPEKLTKTIGILNVAAILVMAVHYFFGLSLYAIFRNTTESDVLENMPEGLPTDIINALFSLTLSVSYILTFFARFNNVWTNTLKPNFKNERLATVGEYVIRIGYNLLAFILAITIPEFKLVSAFSGSLSFIVDVGLSSLMVVLYRITYQKNCFWTVLKNLLIMVMCLVLFGVTMVKNVNEVIESK